MKATKLIAMIAFAGFGMCAEGAFAQGDDESTQTPPPVTEETSTTETEPYNETVTIDDGSATPTAAAEESSFNSQPERKEKLRVYSGKHDGNNVIVDPR